MSTNIRPELSKSSEYYLEKHRYYELKHFCLQYQEWKRSYAMMDGFGAGTSRFEFVPRTNIHSDPTLTIAEAKIYYSDRMEMVKKAASRTDRGLSEYILKGVTEELSYDILKAKLEIPCCKDVYYKLYRRFFWILSDLRR